MDLRNCYERPKEYKFCESGACVLNNEYCPCSHNFFQCRFAAKCIHSSLVCNNVDDCGNNKDEENCFKTDDAQPQECHLSTGAIIGISIGVAVVFILLVLAMLYWLHRKKRLRSQNTSSLEPLRIQTKQSLGDVTSSEGSDVNKRNSGYNKVPLDDSFGPFNDVLCTSTPKPDARRQIVQMDPMPPILILKPS
ncbi:hypothetical protein LOTGIDRAFT_166161 [Lottia gigantea]|uniref:Uncharacterized protein n=1 Tax=Lottia gigantea TaxID=225164 RepID=V3ZZ20_LOTGI|nr:hypothetical protein LOTGIDRAFT_166161 [Lottia gigantea]ESO87860.1 hypothetical protein LOTGIDRAFT_166161 [Lottia gigantea]